MRGARWMVLVGLCFNAVTADAADPSTPPDGLAQDSAPRVGPAGLHKTRIFLVDSYHRDYPWSRSVEEGIVDAMLTHGYLENREQVEQLMAHDVVESARAVIKKEWMDTKRKNSSSDIAQATTRIMAALTAFDPNLVLPSDDNATHYIGTQLLDTDIPVVFSGVNGLPLKYGLVETMERPGHNVTGVWQAGYYKEGVDLLKALVPAAKTFAILAADSETTRPKIKVIQALAGEGKMPLQLVDVVATNSFSEFQRRVLEVAPRVDAFFVINHDTMKDDQGVHVEMLTVGTWYLEHVHKPEVADEDQFVREGMLCAANDSGYNQGVLQFEMAVEILERGAKPSELAPRVPPRGALMVNRRRAQQLGIPLDGQNAALIEEVIDEAKALEHP